MSKTSAALSALKALTLAAIVLLVYHEDFPSWARVLSDPGYAAAFAAGLTLFFFGFWSKRNILSVYGEISRGSLGWGLLTLVFSLASYLYGSYYSHTAWFHYESLILLIVAYLLIRFDLRVVTKQAPLFAILGVSFVPSLLVSRLGFLLAGAVISLVMLALFAAYVGRRVRYLAIPAMITGVELGLWYLSHQLYLALLVSVPLILLFSTWMRSELAPFESGAEVVCLRHAESRAGFCLACGRKHRTAPGLQGYNLYGLFVLIALILVAIFVQVPALALSGNTSYLNTYTLNGLIQQAFPVTPSGWLVNSSSPTNASSDLYSVKQVYVPAYHPEISNYTMYYELSYATPTIASSWGAKPGWNYTSILYQVSGFRGYLITYAAPSKIMMVFGGASTLYFLSGAHFLQVNAGLSIQRTFYNTSSTAAFLDFTNDLESVLSPSFETEAYYSTWSSFLSEAYNQLILLELVSMAVVVSLASVWGIYRVKISDYDTDEFITNAYGLSEKEWIILNLMLNSRRKNLSGIDVADMYRASAANNSRTTNEEIVTLLQRLEAIKLVKATLAEVGSELVLFWRVTQ